VPRPRYYLDHAATSWPKPPGSLEACVEYQTHLGAAAGRGVYHSSEAASQLVRDTRRAIAQWIHAPSERDIALCSNGTQALNAAILGLLASPSMRGAHVVTTSTEHNSVLRPLALAAKNYGIDWTPVPCDSVGWVDPNRIESAMKPNTQLVIINHASNVTGCIQELGAIVDIAKSRGAILILDAAQTLGYLDIHVDELKIDMLAAPGHKGAGGMLGTGLLYVHPSIQSRLEPVWIGGTGTQSDAIDGPFDWSAAIESGNSNLPGIASLKAGIEWVRKHAGQSQWKQLQQWAAMIVAEIERVPSLRYVGPSRDRLPVISLTSETASCHEMAMLLDSACGVEARSGFHCAGLIHSDLGTAAQGGTLRLSLGHTSVQADVDAAIAGIQMLGAAYS
jgi:cysteine desulfurase / selenocysteine lyase